MLLTCLDLEGVLIPEIWVALAERTSLPELRRTTRDEPDYDKLMRGRLEVLARHGITLPDITRTIAGLDPLPGAADFLAWLRSRCQVVILSDTYYEFAMPMMAKLGYPALFCHHLEADAQGRVVGYRLRMKDQKRAAVLAFKSLNYRIAAAGDSHNDLSMLASADYGFFFNPPPAVAQQHPQYPVTHSYQELRAAFEKVLAQES